MHKIYFVFLLCCCQILVAQQGYRSPFDFKLLLAGNFGELRSNHYHSGLDLKTQGGVGKPVHAVEKGYVSRISISAWGYGNGLYLTHPDGTTTVYGHLQRFAPKIAEFARRQQYAKESFMIDVLVSPNQLPVEQGEVVAYSGNTGSSAGPHTHFEVRNTKTEELYDPLIYLKNYFTDTRAPEIRNILICPVPGEGGVNDVERKVRLNTTALVGGKQRVIGKITAWGKIGVALRAEDYMNDTYNRYGVKEITLFADGKQIFHSNLEHYLIPETHYVNSFTDYEYYKKTGFSFIRSFVEPGNKLRFIQTDRNRGYININEERTYNLAYRISDFFGNTTEMTFEIEGKRQNISKPNYSDTTLMHWNVNTDFKARNSQLYIPVGYLYDDLHFIYKEKQDPSGIASIFTMHNHFVPIHNDCRLSLRISKDTVTNKNQYGIVYFQGNGVKWIGGTYKNGWITGNIRELGDFTVRVDSKGPTIVPVNANNWIKRRSITFQLSDNMSGLANFKGTLDGKFVLFEMNNRAVINWKFDLRDLPKGQHTLKLLAWDQCGNASEYTRSLSW